MTLRFGTAGWSYPDWQGIVYPQPRPPGFQELPYLARLFSVLEINSTFYRPPSARVSERWVRQVQPFPDFRFTAKLWSRFSHEATTLQAGEIDLFREGLAPLKEAGILSALLLQFPWSFRKEKANGIRLLRIFEAFSDYPLVLEVRHASWDDEVVRDFLRKHQVGFCNLDQPVIGESHPPSAHVTSEIGYFRFHGRNYDHWFRENAGRDQRYDYLYSQEEIKSLEPMIKEIATKARETIVIGNNHFQGQAPCNILELQQLVTGSTPPIPTELRERFPSLKALLSPQANPVQGP